MDTALWQHALVYGLLMSAILLGIVLASLFFNPNIGLKDYPPEVRKKGRKSQHRDTARHRYWFGIPFLLVTVLAVGLAISQIPRVTGQPLEFLDAFLTALIMLMVFNLLDLLVLDILLGMVIKPVFITPPGTEGMAAHRNVEYYLKAFLRTSLMMLLVSVAFAAFAMAIDTVL
jgi:hypothetical protein